jgi:hypothetical protein
MQIRTGKEKYFLSHAEIRIAVLQDRKPARYQLGDAEIL